MQVTTTRHVAKPFTWSYSKLKNFEACPKRHYHVDIKKDFVEAESEQLREGNRVHKMFEDRIGKGTPFPEAYAGTLEPWVKRAFDVKDTRTGNYRGVDVRDLGARVLVEQKLAINSSFGPTGYFAFDVWHRGKADLIWTLGTLAGVVDWKTGKILEDAVQLFLTAACVFAHYPEVQTVRSTFAWLAEGADTTLDIARADLPRMWSDLWPRIEALREAHQEMSYPPQPGRLCRSWCPVTACPYHGKGA